MSADEKVRLKDWTNQWSEPVEQSWWNRRSPFLRVGVDDRSCEGPERMQVETRYVRTPQRRRSLRWYRWIAT